MDDTRIALVVSNARIGQTDANFERMTGWIEKARNAGATLICFPELQATGYHVKPFLKGLAEPSDSWLIHRLTMLSKSRGMTILAGMAEKAPNNRVYATHLIIRPDGCTGKYRKTHLGPPEKEIFSPGDSLPVFHAGTLHLGVQLCYDAHYPEISTKMALNGAEAIFIPHASPGHSSEAKLASWMRHLPARAFDNGVFIVACNQTGDNGSGLSFPGVALVLSPSGTVLASYADTAEQMLIVDLKVDDLTAVRNHRMRYFLPHRQPELYSNPGN